MNPARQTAVRNPAVLHISRTIWSLILLTASLGAQDLSIAVLRVDFAQDQNPATAGDGRFLLAPAETTCDSWSIDPVPHDATYLRDHLLAADHYWRRVSGGVVGVDLAASRVYPIPADSVYHLPSPMIDYHPYLTQFDETERLVQLARDVIDLADADVDFSRFNTVLIVHAGLGGDFAFVLDPTPANIPSAYLATADFADQGGPLVSEEGEISHCIILPESQNFLQFPETSDLFADSNDPCFYQVGLNGTLALMLGFRLGLDPLFDTETGRSLVGGFALMDQGSNNWHGIVPAPPDPFTRIRMGWDTSHVAFPGDSLLLHVGDPPVRIDISPGEYFLVENRERNLLQPETLTQWVDTLGFDTVSVQLGNSGVVIEVDELDAGLPGNGLLIWHVDENARHTVSNPNAGPIRMVDLEEADGAQDMGFDTNILFGEFLETGWWFDPWFAGNEGWFALNRREPVLGDSLLRFAPDTHPNTDANSGDPSHLILDHIGRAGAAMSFQIHSTRLPDVSAMDEVLGIAAGAAAVDSVWAVRGDTLVVLTIQTAGLRQERKIPAGSGLQQALAEDRAGFQYPWLATLNPEGLRFTNVEDGRSLLDSGVAALGWMQGYPETLEYFVDAPDAYHATLTTTAGNIELRESFGEPIQWYLSVEEFATRDTLYWPGVDPVFLREGAPSPVLVEEENPGSPGGILQRLLAVPAGEANYLGTEIPVLNDLVEMIPVDLDGDAVSELVLVQENSFQVQTLAGVTWNGSPTHHAGSLVNPLLADFLGRGDLQLWLAQATSYQLFSLEGELLESGRFPRTIQGDESAFLMRTVDGLGILLTGSDAQLIHFPQVDPTGAQIVWRGPRGDVANRRVVSLYRQEDPAGLALMDRGQVYNYPNPVRGDRTTIRAGIAAADSWSVEIFSLGGNRVALHSEAVDRSSRIVEWSWSTNDLPNGVYLAQVQVQRGNQSETALIKIAVMR